MLDIPSSSPVSQPAMTYDLWDVQNFSFHSQGSTGPAVMTVTLRRCFKNKDGTYTWMPSTVSTVNRGRLGQPAANDPAIKQFSTPNLFAIISEYPTIGTAIDGVRAALLAYAQNNNLL